jgi:hypothetical protein
VHAQITDLAPGLWIWRLPHPDWREGFDWEPHVTSTVVESRGEVWVLDGLAPPDDDDPVWRRLDARPPTYLGVVKPDHVRSVDLLVRRYGVPAYGPSLFWPDDVPATALEPLEPGLELPGGLRTLEDGRWKLETPIWLPEQRTIVFADGLTAPAGELRVWFSRRHESHVLPALRAMLAELPVERVIVSHGEPVHDRAAFAAALDREPYGVYETDT